MVYPEISRQRECPRVKFTMMPPQPAVPSTFFAALKNGLPSGRWATNRRIAHGYSALPPRMHEGEKHASAIISLFQIRIRVTSVMPAGTIRIRRVVFALMLIAATAAWQSSWGGEPALQRWPNGTPTPSLELRDPDGREWKLHDLRGKVVVLNFWASWCAPCVDEIPFLNGLANDPALAGKVTVLGVNFKESTPTVRRFSQAHEFGYPVLLDKTGEAFKRWTSGVLPTTVLVDRNGHARWRSVGELDRTDSSLKDAIGKLLDGQELRHAGRVGSK